MVQVITHNAPFEINITCLLSGGLPLNIYRGNSRRDKLLGETIEWYRPRSLGNLSQIMNEDSVSMLSEKYRRAYSSDYNVNHWSQSLEQISDSHEKYRDIPL